jgi:hypothetical protein
MMHKIPAVGPDKSASRLCRELAHGMLLVVEAMAASGAKAVRRKSVAKPRTGRTRRDGRVMIDMRSERLFTTGLLSSQARMVFRNPPS